MGPCDHPRGASPENATADSHAAQLRSEVLSLKRERSKRQQESEHVLAGIKALWRQLPGAQVVVCEKSLPPAEHSFRLLESCSRALDRHHAEVADYAARLGAAEADVAQLESIRQDLTLRLQEQEVQIEQQRQLLAGEEARLKREVLDCMVSAALEEATRTTESLREQLQAVQAKASADLVEALRDFDSEKSAWAVEQMELKTRLHKMEETHITELRNLESGITQRARRALRVQLQEMQQEKQKLRELLALKEEANVMLRKALGLPKLKREPAFVFETGQQALDELRAGGAEELARHPFVRELLQRSAELT